MTEPMNRETFEPKTIKEAIDNLQTFLECDMWSCFSPIEIINGKEWIRDGCFHNEKDMINYLKAHFSIMRDEIKRLEEKMRGKKK